MFHSKENEVSKIHTLIGSDCTITGDLSSMGHLEIDGTINGDILCEDIVIIGDSGNINGNITCDNGYIKGTVKGNIICNNTLTIEAGGKVIGNIQVKKVIINENGMLDGKCTMITDDNPSVFEVENC